MSNNQSAVETLKLYHTGDDYKVSQVLALAESDKIKTHDQNICEDKLSGTQLLTLSNKLDMSLKDMVDHDSELYKSSIKNSQYDEAGWLEILIEYPELLKSPIAEKGKEIMIIETPTDILKMKNIDKGVDGYNHS